MSRVEHEQEEIASALAACADAGLRVEPAAGGVLWGAVSCPTGARALCVPHRARWPEVQARRLLVFRAEHSGHEAGAA